VPAVWAQTVISAHAGIVNYIEGEVYLENAPLKLGGAIFPDVKLNQTLSARVGYAEILLTSEIFLRLDKNTSARIISNALTDIQVQILAGSALVEASEVFKGNRVLVKMGDSETVLLKAGLYHFNADAGRIRAFRGKAKVSDPSHSIELKGGETLSAGPAPTPVKFNREKSKDELYTWSEKRDDLLAAAGRGANKRGFDNGSFDLGACRANSPGDSLPCPPARP
jgi:hypothetical protein